MKKLLSIVFSVFTLGGCVSSKIKKPLESTNKLQVKRDLQIGDYVTKNKKIPIRQIRIFEETECSEDLKQKKCLLQTIGNFCGFYIDINDNGKYDYKVDLHFGKANKCRKKEDPLPLLR